MISIDVPDVPAPPGICWNESPGMERCTYPAGHPGPHQWARLAPLPDPRLLTCCLAVNPVTGAICHQTKGHDEPHDWAPPADA